MDYIKDFKSCGNERRLHIVTHEPMRIVEPAMVIGDTAYAAPSIVHGPNCLQNTHDRPLNTDMLIAWIHGLRRMVGLPNLRNTQ
jgi:hypothetical protein